MICKKNYYYLAIIFIIFFSGCNTSEIKSNIKNNVKSLIDVDIKSPVLEMNSQTKNSKSLSISFNSSEDGTLLYENDCQSKTKNVKQGKNIIIFDDLENGYYDFCTITIVDFADNISNTVAIPAFYVNNTEIPSLTEVMPITSNTFNDSPTYTFRSSSEGKISYSGDCKSLQHKAKIGDNVITFNKLKDGYYDNCSISVINQEGVESKELQISPFSINKDKEIEIIDFVTPKRLATLDYKLKESSGIIYIDGKLYTHTDSSGKAQLYEIDSHGKIVRTITINGAINIDWEDITQDDFYIYIADIGNNNGKRKDLKIYKIDKEMIQTQKSVDCKIIEVSYEDQENFKYEQFSTPYDAEAIIAYKDNLYIFTKNWNNKVTKVYAVPKRPGSHILNEVSSYSFDFLITGATYNKKADKIILIGYNSRLATTQHITVLENFSNDDFFSGDLRQIEIDSSPIGFRQIEAITSDGAEKVYITSEEMTNKFLGNHPSSLFEIRIIE